MIALRLQYSMLNVQVCRLLPTSHGCVPDCFVGLSPVKITCVVGTACIRPLMPAFFAI